KLTVLFLLASNPKFGINGVAIAMSVGVVLVTLLHLATLNKTIQFSIPFKDLSKMILLVLLTSVFARFFQSLYITINDILFHFLLILILLTCIYICLLFILRCIIMVELKQIFIMQKWF